MPEVDFSRLGKLSGGKYAERARRSLEVVVLDKKLVAALGGADRVPDRIPVVRLDFEYDGMRVGYFTEGASYPSVLVLDDFGRDDDAPHA
jgi:hypothetical protein